MTRRQALGRGLDALLPAQPSSPSGLQQIPLERIQPNAYQPRVRFSAESLQQLAESIRQNGILQPIVVRPVEGNFEIVAGERRWRAAQQAGLERLPALIQTVSDQQMVELALIENIQRDDLSPIEEAQAYQLLLDEFALTQEDIASRVSRSRSAVANTLRLLRLPREVQEMLLGSQLSMGHARALLPLSRGQQVTLAQVAVARGLSVRELERRVKKLLNPAPRTVSRPIDPNLLDAQERLEEHCQARVEIRQRGNKGHIRIHFHSPEELERLYNMLMGEHGVRP